MGIHSTPPLSDLVTDNNNQLNFCLSKMKTWRRVASVSFGLMIVFGIVYLFNFFTGSISSQYAIAQMIIVVVYVITIAIARSKQKTYSDRALACAQRILRPKDLNVIDVESREVER